MVMDIVLKTNIKLKNSIKVRFFIAIFAIAVAFISIISILNLFFYDDYYLYTRKNILGNMLSNLSDTYDGSLPTIQSALNQMELQHGLRLSIIGTDGTLIYDTIAYGNIDNNQKTFSFFNGQTSTLFDSLRIAITAFDNADQSRLLAGKYEYVTVQDSAKRSEYLCIVGMLRDDIVVARIPYSYMEQNTSFNSTFLLITGSITLFLCFALAFLISGRFTKPLIEMNHIANAMSKMDFSKKYEGYSLDEIGQLGASINLLSEHLESSIRELQASNNQLACRIREKEQIDEMRREFIINVSHELKTPIAVIQGYAEGLKEGVAESEDDRDFYCSTITEEAVRMNKMVTNLLSLSKLELGRMTPEIISVDICALCRRAVDTTAVLWQEKGLKVTSESSSIMVKTDEEMLSQVIQNYLSNAIRYTPIGGKITISVVQEPCKATVLSVFNEGDGVSEADLPLLWEKFYRTDKARSRELGGTGIGLSIVQATAETLGATCGAENISGGICFWFRLPSNDKSNPI